MKFGCCLLLMVCMQSTFSATVFNIPDLSETLAARIKVNLCSEDECNGRARVEIVDKASKKILQTFSSKDISIRLRGRKIRAVNDVHLRDLRRSMVFDDFNFDGTRDLAIRNGNRASYGGPSFDVYVYNITRRKFVRSKSLTELASTKLGMFRVDHKRQRLVTHEKSGCCWHLTTEYAVVPRKGLIKVRTVEESAGGDYVDVTTSELVDGKWRREKKRHTVKAYYGE